MSTESIYYTLTDASETGGMPGVISPDAFNFEPDPNDGNWQKTGCVTIIFGRGSPFLPIRLIKVGVIVGAPIQLRDGRTISRREAQLDSANAAQSASQVIKERLDSGTMIETEVQPAFVGFMYGAIEATGLGYRVNGCKPR
ncbi:hypothetical protein [Streptomyces sp.]|uniref:hypothetical protein n=1 Tax=Streptomyces sp. TaxID=1931 RepID=UPI002D6FE6E8|nr:hypothetical protein [Streptomyces sp.]HZF91946.1 hypothetical protein [Streptomyces sp.]